MRIWLFCYTIILFLPFSSYSQQEKPSLSYENREFNTGFISSMTIGITSNQLHLSPYFSYKSHSLFAGISSVNYKESNSEEAKIHRAKYGASTNFKSPTFNIGYRFLYKVGNSFFFNTTLMYYEIESTFSEGFEQTTTIGPAFSLLIGPSHVFDHGSFNYGLGFTGGKVLTDLFFHFGLSINIFKLNTSN